jgi:hypothetical protein
MLIIAQAQDPNEVDPKFQRTQDTSYSTWLLKLIVLSSLRKMRLDHKGGRQRPCLCQTQVRNGKSGKDTK